MSLKHLFLLVLNSLLISNTTATNSTLKNVTNIEEIVLADIENAFRSVTNVTDTILHDKIIPEMYNITRSSHTLIFKIPDSKNELGFTMISTDRRELMQPIFPNLTINPVQVMLKKTGKSEDMNKLSISNANEWSSLGLDGWLGDLKNATDMLEFVHKDFLKFKTQDSEGAEFDKINMFNKTTTTIASKPGNTKTMNNISDNIYIGRVNDPFGLSTKWSYRNQTNNASVEVINTNDKRPKRDIVELYSMLKCATGCEPLVFKSYGCFCGFLGNGIAVDGIDSCCRMHDKCYEHSNCVSYLQYFVPYVWKCYHGKPLCALDHGEYGGPTSCAALLCYCDMRLAICLRKYQCPLRKAVCNTSLARKLQNLFF